MGGEATVKPVAGGIGGEATNHRRNRSSVTAINLPVPANSTLHYLPYLTSKPLFPGECSTRTVQPTDQREDHGAVGSYYDSVFRPVPSRIEVDKAISNLQRFMLGFRTTEFEWLQRMLYLHNPSTLKSLGFGSVDDAFRLLQTDPSVQRMVSSISSDKAVWDAILSNKAVQNLQQSLSAAKEEGPQSSSGKPDLATIIVDWILDLAMAKVLELIEGFISLLTMIFQRTDQKKNLGATNTDGQLDEKIRSSLLLSIVILLIVVVTRAHGVQYS